MFLTILNFAATALIGHNAVLAALQG